VLDDIVAWAPRAWFAKHHNGRAAKGKDRLFLAALKGLIERVRLNNSPNRQGSDLRKREAPEVASLQNVYTAFVAKKNVLLVLQRMLIDCPEAVPQPIMI
jgi:hypothetical protein